MVLQKLCMLKNAKNQNLNKLTMFNYKNIGEQIYIITYMCATPGS